MPALKKTSIGGQALIEGVMMRGPQKSAMAVRLPDGSIDTEVWETKPLTAWYQRTPLVRGVFNFVESLRVGYRCLSKSIDKTMPEEEPTSKFEKFLEEKLGDRLTGIITGAGVILGLLLAIFLFLFLPSGIIKLLEPVLHLPWLMTILEAAIKIAIFVLYLWAISAMPDIRRMFQYHGAEHKTIACYEAGLELTVENIRGQSRFHPRCGTSFILIVLIISALIFSMVSWDSLVLRVGLKLLLLPVVMGISYELLKLAGRYTNVLTKILSAPGLWLQRLSTREPDDSQIQVAIASMEPAIPDDPECDRW